MGYESDISISNLQLCLNNPRCLFVDTEEDALYELLMDQGGDKRTNKIVSLARSIAETGLSPTELLIVMPDKSKDGSFVVMEGNRRLAALKCLNNPRILLNSFPTLKNAFDGLSALPILEARCYVTENKSEVDTLIERRHNGQNGGAGIIPWSTEQRARFMERTSGKKDKIVHLIEYLHSVFGKGSPEEIWLNKCKKTSLARLFNTPYVREKLGFELGDSIYVPKSPDPIVLSRFLEKVSETSVGDVYDLPKRKAFIDDILNEFGNTPSTWQPEIDLGTNTNGNGNEPKTVGSTPSRPEIEDNTEGAHPKGYSRNRKTVAPREGSPLPTQGEANLSQIHHELKVLTVDQSPIACALLLRALIVLSTDAYLKTKLSVEEYTRINNDRYTSKIQRVCSELVKDKNSGLGNNDVDYMRKFAQNNDGIPVTLSSLNASAHGSNGWPDGHSLISLWDKIYKVIKEMLSAAQAPN